MLITSTKNPRVKQVIALRERRERDRTGLMRVEGYEEISLALASGIKPVSLFYCPELISDKQQLELLARIRQAGAEIIEVDRRVFDAIAYREGADGWLAIFPIPHYNLADARLQDQSFVVVVESIEKPGNLGAILRTADAAGVDLLIVADAVTDLSNPNTVRASKGALFSLPVAQGSSEEVIDWLRGRHIRVVVATPHATVAYTDADLRGAVAIVVGSEAEGVSQAWLDHADTRVCIPMFGRVDSLNVSTAAAVLIYEVVRQRGRGPGARGQGPEARGQDDGR